MKDSIIKEINKKYVEAVEGYEDEIQNHEDVASPDTYINLAFLYWCFAFEFFEVVIPNAIPDHWSVKGGDSFLRILNSGLNKFPNNLELHFWKKYFFHIAYGEDFTKGECLQLIGKYNGTQSAVPYFFLYLFNKDKYKEQKMELLKIAEVAPTAKNLYIKSILSSNAGII